MENKYDSIVIRKAKREDTSIILKLIEELAVYEKLSHTVVNTEKMIQKYLFDENKFAEALIADYDNKPVGFALFFHNYSTFVGKPGIYLEDLFVQPEMRGKGIGKKLFMELITIAKDRDCGRIEWSVLNWNTPAIDFYKSMGALSMDEWTVYRLTEDKFKSIISA